jgi:hypothetical protein
MGGVFRNPEGGLTVEAPSGLVSGKASLEPEGGNVSGRVVARGTRSRERLILAYRPWSSACEALSRPLRHLPDWSRRGCWP